jgi:hypothetical protein
MDATRIKIVKDDLNKYINVPVNMQWDFMGRDESIDEYETAAVNEVIGEVEDFEIIRFAHNVFQNFESSIRYNFYFYDYSTPITGATVGAWTSSYLNNGFSVQDVYYYSKSFTKSFFKLDLYDSPNENEQTSYLSIILPVQQGLTQTAILSALIPPVQIKKSEMVLDYIGTDKEGFFIYWLRKRNFIDINTFYMSARFFDSINGNFKQMTNTRQDLILPDKFTFDHAKYYYYKVNLNYTAKTYQVFSTFTNLRVGANNSPINYFEFVNP